MESIETSDKADEVLAGLIQAMSYAITLPEVVKVLRKKLYPRLFRILLENDMHDQLSINQISGITLALYAQGFNNFSESKAFYDNLDETQLSMVLKVYEKTLLLVHKESKIVRWLLKNLTSFNRSLEPMFEHLDKRTETNAYQLI